MTDKSLLDYDTMLENLGEQALMAEKIYELFLSDSEKKIGRISHAVDEADFTLVKSQAHSLKGSCLYIVANQLHQACKALEEAASEHDATKMQNMLTDLQTVYDNTVTLIEKNLAAGSRP
jgi:HPt (histidine-containing phosphotransfer) domain-containing protein